MDPSKEPIMAHDRDPREAESYANQLATEIDRTGIKPVKASVGPERSLEITFSDGEVVKFNTLFAGRPGYGTRTTARVLRLLNFSPPDFGNFRRKLIARRDIIVLHGGTRSVDAS